MTRNAELTEKVRTDPNAHSNIGCHIDCHLAYEEKSAQKPLKYFDDVDSAWLALRDLIADEKIRAEGHLIERRGLQEPIEMHFPDTAIRSGEAGDLILLDHWGGFTETVLGPDETYRFHNGQGRYWKGVRLLAENLLAAFPTNPTNPRSRANSAAKPNRRKGRTPDPLWEDCRQYALELLRERGIPRSDDADPSWRKQAHFERLIHKWWVERLPHDAQPPCPSNVRLHVVKWQREFEQERTGQ
jgi:hypothetical protein